MKNQYYAVIDIGSNSIRLVIYLKEHGSRVQEIENIKTVARLRNYLDEQQRLNEDGIALLIHTLKSFKNITDTYPHFEGMICAATATIREANNQTHIRKCIQQEVGWNLVILSEEQEAYYGYLAVVNSIAISEGLTVDVGGGSTEISYFKDRRLIHTHSFPFGALTLMEYMDHDRPDDLNIKHIRLFIEKQLDSLPWLRHLSNIPIIAIGGSARNLVQIDQNCQNYPLAGLHQYQMNESTITYISNYLTTLSAKEREKVEGLSKDRADHILPAIQVFYCLYRYVSASTFILSRKGLRDGLFFQRYLTEYRNKMLPDILENSLNELKIEYNLDSKQLQHVMLLTEQLFNAFLELGIGDLSEADWPTLRLASQVYNLGKYIDSEASSQHTFYLLANRTIDGLWHRDRLQMALIASYKNKRTFKQFIKPYKSWFLKSERKRLQLMGAMLKFAYSADTSKQQMILNIMVKRHQNVLQFVMTSRNNTIVEKYQCEKQKKYLEKALKQPIEIIFLQS